MQKSMMALVAHAPYDYRYEEVPMPGPLAHGEMLLKVEACGICAGDIKSYHGGIRIWGTTPENRYIEAPSIGGHEFVGTIVEVAPGVTGFAAGDRVVAEQIVPCGQCSFCCTGQYWMCAQSAVFGFKTHCQGGFAQYVKIPKQAIMHKVPENFTTQDAVMIEPIACGMHAVERGHVQHNDVVVVAGLGAIGLSMVNLICLQLPRMVIGLDIREHRLALGREYGADAVFSPVTHNVVEEVRKLTGGLGCDLYIEASGSPKSVSQGLEMLKNLGRYVQIGVFAQEVQADWNVIGDGKELQIMGSHLSALTYPSVIKGIQAGLIKTDGLVSQSFALKDWKEAFNAAENKPEAMKIMLRPN